MHHMIGALLLGAIGGRLAANSDRLHPVVRSIVKGGIIAKRKIEAVGGGAIAETRKIVEEARAELDRSGTELHS